MTHTGMSRSFQNFFFSSRRRHTRYIGDWSSDVCSSDLPFHKEGLHAAGLRYPGHTEILAERTGVKEFGMMLYAPPGPSLAHGIGVVHVTLHMALRDVFR